MKLSLSLGNSRAELLAIFLLLLAIGLLYGHTLQVPFYLDDNAIFNGNYLLRDLPAAATNLFSQRGLTHLTFAVNFRLGGWSLLQLHLVNIILHAGCGLLVWRLLRRMVAGFWLPLAGALLFVVHPLQTQGVTYLVQRSTVLGAFGFLVAFLCHLRARGTLPADHGLRSAEYWKWYLATIFVGGCAVLAKENTATLPLVLIAYDYLFPRAESRSRGQALFDYLPFFVVPLWLGIVTLGQQTGEKVAGYSYYPLESLLHNDPLHYLVTQFSVFWRYLRLLLVPYGQALEHDYPVVAELLTLHSAIALTGLLAIVWLAWRLRQRLPLLAFGVAWFFLTLAVESSFIPLDPLFEHRLYLPMFGFVLILLDGLPALLGERRSLLVLGLVLLVCLPLTWRRNALWNDPIAFYEDNLQVVPGSERAMVELAFRYEQVGRYDEKRQLLEEAISLHPRNHEFYVALAEFYADHQGEAAALGLLEEGLGRMPHNLELYERAALIAERFGDRELVFSYLQRGLAAVPDTQSRLLNDLGIYHAQQGDLARAEELYRQSLSFDSDNAVAYQYLGGLYFFQQRWVEALEALLQSLRLEPGNPKTLEGVAKTSLKLGDIETATWAAKKLRYSDPILWHELQTAIEIAKQGERK